jgi:hypothetical protein
MSQIQTILAGAIYFVVNKSSILQQFLKMQNILSLVVAVPLTKFKPEISDTECDRFQLLGLALRRDNEHGQKKAPQSLGKRGKRLPLRDSLIVKLRSSYKNEANI